MDQGEDEGYGTAWNVADLQSQLKQKHEPEDEYM